MDIHVERIINQPAPEVFDFFADAANNPRWQQGMESCRWTTRGPTQVGSIYEQTARFMGRAVVSTFRVTRFEPGRSISIATTQSTFPIQVTRTVEPIDDSRCRVMAHIAGGPQGLLRLLNPITNRMARKSIEGDYDRLVQHFA